LKKNLKSFNIWQSYGGKVDCLKWLVHRDTVLLKNEQEGQHPLTGQLATNFRRDLEATYDFN